MDIALERRDAVAIIHWRDGENRINTDSMGRLLEIVAALKEAEGPLAVVLTGDGKFFSNGLDLARFATDDGEFTRTVKMLDRFFADLLDFPGYVVGALNGHAFAGGAMISSVFDYRVMREDRGYWCLNEAELGLPLTPSMFKVVTARLPHGVALEAANTARRFSATEALAAGLVHDIAPENDVLARAVAKAAEVATKDRKVVATHKRLAFGELADWLRGH